MASNPTLPASLLAGAESMPAHPSSAGALPKSSLIGMDVRVRRTGRGLEDGWRVISVTGDGSNAIVRLLSPDGVLYKEYRLRDLLAMNPDRLGSARGARLPDTGR